MKDMDPETSYVCLADLLPQQNEDAAKTLLEFEVCLCNGIVAGSEEAFASTKIKRDVDLTAVHANWNIKNAHHDMVLPVRCKSSQKNMLFGVSARNGHHKTETDLLKTKQHLVSKEDGSEEVSGLLQAVNPRGGKSTARKLKNRLLELTKQKRYAEVMITSGQVVHILGCFD